MIPRHRGAKRWMKKHFRKRRQEIWCVGDEERFTRHQYSNKKVFVYLWYSKSKKAHGQRWWYRESIQVSSNIVFGFRASVAQLTIGTLRHKQLIVLFVHPGNIRGQFRPHVLVMWTGRDLLWSNSTLVCSILAESKVQSAKCHFGPFDFETFLGIGNLEDWELGERWSTSKSLESLKYCDKFGQSRKNKWKIRYKW